MKQNKTIIVFWAISLLTVINATAQSPVVVKGKVNVFKTGKMAVYGKLSLKSTDTQNGILTNRGNLALKKGLVMESGAEKDAMLLNYLTLSTSGSAIPDFQVKKSFTTKKWNYISFPFDVKISDIKNANPASTPMKIGVAEGGIFSNNFWVRQWDLQSHANGASNSFKDLTENDVMRAGVGYAFAVNTDLITDVIFPATNSIAGLGADNRQVQLAYTTGSAKQNYWGWNYIGTAQLSGFQLNQANTAFPDVVFVHKNTGGFDFFSLDMDSVLAGNYTAFYCRTPSPGKSFTYTHSGQRSDYQATKYRSSAENPGIYDLALTYNNGSDKCRFVFDDTYSGNEKLSYKLMSGEVSEIWIADKSGESCVNRLPYNLNREIPLGLSIIQDNTYTISMKGNNPAGWKEVNLVDKVSGNRYNLLESDYTFTAPKSVIENRFALQFNKYATGIESPSHTSGITTFVENSTLNVKNLISGDLVHIYDLTGGLITSKAATDPHMSIALPAPGVYLVKIAGKSTYTAKIIN